MFLNKFECENCFFSSNKKGCFNKDKDKIRTRPFLESGCRMLLENTLDQMFFIVYRFTIWEYNVIWELPCIPVKKRVKIKSLIPYTNLMKNTSRLFIHRSQNKTNISLFKKLYVCMQTHTFSALKLSESDSWYV